MSESITKDAGLVLAIIFLIAALVILPIYVAYYFFRWCRYRTLFPLLVIIAIFFVALPISSIINAEFYGQNLNMVMAAWSMLILGDALIFSAWVAGQIYRLAIGRKGRMRLKEQYYIPGYARDSIEEHHLMIAAISPFPFVLFSLLQFRWLTGTVSGVLSAFWYLSILFYLFVAVFIAATWFKDLF